MPPAPLFLFAAGSHYTTTLARSSVLYRRTPIAAHAQDAPKADTPPKKYNSIATAGWDDEKGKHQAVVSYAESPDKDRAEDLAMKGCFAKGAKECRTHGPWDEGCVYAAVFYSSKTGNRFWRMSENEEDLYKHARETGRSMTKPIGGCVSEPRKTEK
jgi:hypothetical protein